MLDDARGQALIGRSIESDQLDEALRRVSGGDSRLVIVAGEAGIGKTRLVDAFVSRARHAGARCMIGGCQAFGADGLPYGPFIEAFRGVFRDVDPGALPALLGPSRGELARLMPEVRPRPDRDAAGMAGDGSPAVVADERFAQVRLFELVLGVIERLARDGSLVLVVEDLQWADPSTRDLLGFLVRNLRRERVLLIATIRTDEPDTHGAFMGYLAELERLDRVYRIDLERLGRAELAMLLADRLGETADPALVDWTWERTAGNPFYAEQLLAISREGAGRELPARLRDILLARVTSVAATGQEILRVASAAGARIDDELLVAVADMPADLVHAALRDIVARRILIAAGDAAEPYYVFGHALLQELIHAELFPGERARLHARYAVALEGRAAARSAGQRTGGPSPSAAELAYHWDAAGDAPRALVATIEAARSAEGAYAFLEAHRRYLRALQLWDLVPDTDRRIRTADRVDLLVRAAETAVLTGAYRSAVDLGWQAVALVDPVADPSRAAGLRERQRWYLWESGDRVAAEAAVVEAARLIPERPPSAARARILAHHAGILMSTGRILDSIPVAEEALIVARAATSPADEALALGVLGWDLALSGRVDEGLANIRAGLAIAESLGGAEGIALGTTNLADLLDRVGRTNEAVAVALDGWERVRAVGVERTYGGLLLAIAAKAAIALGRWDDADRYLDLALGNAPVGNAGIRLRIQRGRLDTFRGDLAAAAVALGAARSAVEGAGAIEDGTALLTALAELAAATGSIAETRAAVVEGLRLASDRLPDPALASLAATGLRVEADAAGRARSRHDDAAVQDARGRSLRILEQVDRIATVLGLPPASAPGPIEPTREAILTALCRIEARRLDDRDDGPGWISIADGFDAIGRPYPAAYARFRSAAALLRDRGSRDAAEAALTAAHTTAAMLGAKPLLAEVDMLARQARLKVRPRDGGRVDEVAAGAGAQLRLTDREREVLGRIAAGWSNQQIADALFISRKTASVHASNIFDKLGAANRVEAAAIAHRLGLDTDAPVPPGEEP